MSFNLVTNFTESKVTSVESERMTTDKQTDARKLDHATLEAMRFRAIEATKAGMKATDLALAYGVHRRTVFRWLATLEKRIEELEQRGATDTGMMLLIVVSVAPGELDRPIDTLKQQDGPKAWQRADDETEADFTRRVRVEFEQQGHDKPVLLLANTDD